MAKGVIYILTNPSFPQYVKIGYADDLNQRLAQLNRSECIPFAFRVYAYYKVINRLTDKELHKMIDKLNPKLRAIDVFNGKKREREFYAMEAEDAYSILENIANINGLQKNLVKVVPTKEEEKSEQEANEIIELSINRHHFKEIDFTTYGKKYHGKRNEKGTLSIIDLTSNMEIKNNSKPSKKDIVGQAIKELGVDVDKNVTLYQRYHKLTKMILG